MRIRKSFAGVFVGLSLVAGYSGLAALPPVPYQEYHSDKVLHFLTFFLLTISFYWILETTRKRVLHLTLLVCTLGLGVGSEVAQGIIPNGREFDYLDIGANVLGSLAAIGLCTAYHRRMLERKRAARGFKTATEGESGLDDVELGGGVTGSQESGVVGEATAGIDEELEHWDENATDDWEEEDPAESLAAETNGLSHKT